MFEKKLDGKNDKAENKHENADAIDTMHVFYKPGFWPVGIWFFNVEIFRYLLKYAHKKTVS